jgi:hypothetical protein
MRWRKRNVCTLLVIGFVCSASGQDKRGAKALFLDPTTGVAVIPKDATGVSRPGTTVPPVPKPTSTSKVIANVPPRTANKSEHDNPGLMYWVELVKPNGELQRVNTSRQFRSGERVRLHFESNFNGRLAIFQQQDDKLGLDLLFPDKRVAGGTDQIKANLDTVIPSERAWLKFDNNPGKVKLLVLLATEERYGEVIQPNIASSTVDRDKSLKIADRVQKMRGKGLVVEVDETSTQPATYVVNPGKPKNDPNSGVVAVEILLDHRP